MTPAPALSAAKDASAWIPDRPTLPRLRRAAAGCEGCPLYRRATQTVFGEGPAAARLVLVGEQPGDAEDREGHPFVGPAGRLLDAALEEAGIDRASVYVTNTVKHFKWEPSPSGKRRLHKKPSAREAAACRPWLAAELEVLEPEAVVALGATAAQGLLGRDFRVSRERGRWTRSPWLGDGVPVLATVHPSSILRAPDEAARRRERKRFVADLRAVAALLKKRG
ncbi:MAG TPA: UdgX family uracil-DNA binding protein [Candidatus Methylacidiphilales bacterium]